MKITINELDKSLVDLIEQGGNGGSGMVKNYHYRIEPTVNDQKDFIIPLSSFNKDTDFLMVTQNRTVLEKNEYTVVRVDGEQVVRLVEGVENYTESSISMYILKNAPEGNDTDPGFGSGISEEEVQEIVNTHENKTDIHTTLEEKEKLSNLVNTVNEVVESKYEKPSTGIPSTDLDQSVQNALSGSMYAENVTKTATSNAIGKDTIATGNLSYAEGDSTTASAAGAHAEGNKTKAEGLYSHAEGSYTIAEGSGSHSEGLSTKAEGAYAHAEGRETIASGNNSHAEGENTTAKGNSSHAEGSETLADGLTAHAEGMLTKAIGDYTHSSGYMTTALLNASHAEGYKTFATGADSYDIKSFDNTTKTLTTNKALWFLSVGNTIYVRKSDGSVFKGKITVVNTTAKSISIETTEVLDSSCTVFYALNDSYYTSHAEGSETLALNGSHAEGRLTQATGVFSHAEGDGSLSIGNRSHAEGGTTKALDHNTHSEGSYTVAVTSGSHSQGEKTIAGGSQLYKIIAVSDVAKTIQVHTGVSFDTDAKIIIFRSDNHHLIYPTIKAISGTTITLTTTETLNANMLYLVTHSGTGANAHAGGYSTIAVGNQSTAFGESTIAEGTNSFAIGKFNKNAGIGEFVIGNGVNNLSRANIFRVSNSGSVYGIGAYNSTGADYAELFEWADGNTENEDRVGYFVTVSNGKIRKSTSKDKYILGIVSSTPSVIGDSYQDDWNNRYLTDTWGRVLKEWVDLPEVTREEPRLIPDGKGNFIETSETIIVLPARREERPVHNPDWNHEEEYIPREKRPEWSPIGIMGKLLVHDDGTCEVNGYCKSNNDGIATASDDGYIVLERISENVVKVFLK